MPTRNVRSKSVGGSLRRLAWSGTKKEKRRTHVGHVEGPVATGADEAENAGQGITHDSNQCSNHGHRRARDQPMNG